MKILIVEDEPTNRQLLQEFLTPFGDCDLANDGREGLNNFKTAWESKQPYDLICLDIMMPNVDGIEMLRTIRDFEKSNDIYGGNRTKIIMVTAVGDHATILESFIGGAASYIVKPVQRKKLIQEMQNLGLIAANIDVN